MYKKIFLYFLFLSFSFLTTQADHGIRDKACRVVWKVSYVEVEGYLYPDTALGKGTYIQFKNNGRCIMRTIEFKDFDSEKPIKKIDLTKGHTEQQTTDFILNTSDSTLIINPSASEKWAWKIIEASDNKIIFTSDFYIAEMGETLRYKFTLVPVIGCSTLE
jgi:hypothetical protein